jgi:N-acetylglucosamine kinase-like BadF-type ATPase
VRVRAVRGGKTVASLAVSGPRVTDLPGVLSGIWRQRGWTRAAVSTLVVGSRGLWSAKECQGLAARLSSLARRVEVLSDAQVALLAALGDRPGLLVLAGTGAIVVGRDARGCWGRASGHGPLLGDEGSGFWLGREWLRAGARDGREGDLLAAAHSSNPVATIAALAPRVLSRARRRDPRARRIVKEGGRHLATAAVAVARRLGLPRPVLVSWAGSVMSDRFYRAGVDREMARAGLRIRWHRPDTEPVAAAVSLAGAPGAHPRAATERPTARPARLATGGGQRARERTVAPRRAGLR